MEYLHETRASHDLYGMWIKDIDLIDRVLTVLPNENQDDVRELSKRVAVLLFPIIESISINIFQGGLRKYLKELDYSSKEADLISKMFRNGFSHYNRAMRLEYEDGIVMADWHSVSGSSGLLQAHSRKAFTYYKSGDCNRACLELHWFATQVKTDLESRLEGEEPFQVNYVIGQKIEGTRPEAEALQEDESGLE